MLLYRIISYSIRKAYSSLNDYNYSAHLLFGGFHQLRNQYQCSNPTITSEPSLSEPLTVLFIRTISYEAYNYILVKANIGKATSQTPVVAQGVERKGPGVERDGNVAETMRLFSTDTRNPADDE